MLFLCPSKDQDVVQIDHHNAFCYEVSKDVVHHGLEGGVKDVRSDPEWSGITPEWKRVDNKVGEQSWPQLVHCALICCRVCGCIF